MIRLLMIVATLVACCGSANSAVAIRSKTGIVARVAVGAWKPLRCVMEYVQNHGVRIVAMRGYGGGTVSHSMHPSGRALDINQTGRGVFHGTPYIPPRVSNAAADKCGVVSGARWHNQDNGHWNLRR